MLTSHSPAPEGAHLPVQGLRTLPSDWRNVSRSDGTGPRRGLETHRKILLHLLAPAVCTERTRQGSLAPWNQGHMEQTQNHAWLNSAKPQVHKWEVNAYCIGHWDFGAVILTIPEKPDWRRDWFTSASLCPMPVSSSCSEEWSALVSDTHSSTRLLISPSQKLQWSRFLSRVSS